MLKADKLNKSEDNAPLLGQDTDLWILIAQTSNLLLKVRKRDLAKHGSAPGGNSILAYLQAMGGKATSVQINNWLILEPHSTIEKLRRMEKRGLVTITKDLPNKNHLNITITEKGIETYNHNKDAKSVQEILSALSESQREQLISIMKVLKKKTLSMINPRENYSKKN